MCLPSEIILSGSEKIKKTDAGALKKQVTQRHTEGSA